jgi:L,D-transpeptidase ErfK/SrfK
MANAIRSTICGLLVLLAAGGVAAESPRAVETPSGAYALSPGEDVVGGLQSVTARHEDTLPDLARLFDLGYEEITRANPGLDPWLPGEQARVVLPTLFVMPDAPREGLVLNIAGMRLYYYRKGKQVPQVYTHPIGIGRLGWSTPLGRTKITAKAKDPSWYVPESIRKEHAEEGDPLPPVVPPGPDNPLGRYVLRLGMPGYLIHGTNKPWGVGMRVSHGCIRLYPEDIEGLYAMVPRDAPVTIVDQPYLAGWHEGRLLFTAYRPLEETGGDWLAALELLDRHLRNPPEGASTAAIDWGRVARITREGMGVAFPVQEDAPDVRQWIASATQVRDIPVASYQPSEQMSP